MTKQIVVENRLERAQIVENEKAADGRRRLTFEAVVAEGDFVNQNKRVYPSDVLWEAFSRVNDDIGAYPGAVDHPFSGDASFSDNGILWRNFWQEGNTIKGKGEIIWTARGADLAANMEAGVKVGFSTRTYATVEEEERDGETVAVIREMEPPYVDAVVNPSVKHARLSNFAREHTENKEVLMEELEQVRSELETAKTDLEAANQRIATLESAATSAAEERATERATATSEADQLRAKIAQLESDNAELRAKVDESELNTLIDSLVEGHRFAATIKAEIDGLRALGVTVNAENAEQLVARFKTLTEAAASAVNENGPKGELSEDEDNEPEDEGAESLTEQQIADLRAARLSYE